MNELDRRKWLDELIEEARYCAAALSALDQELAGVRQLMDRLVALAAEKPTTEGSASPASGSPRAAE